MDTIADYNAWKAKQEQSSAEAANVVLQGLDVQPDQAAGDMNLADEFGKVTGGPVPPAPMVREYRGVFQQAIERERNRTILSSSPILSDWLRNPDNAAVAKDDLKGLSWWETVAGAGKNAMSRGVQRVPMAFNQFLANAAGERAQDASKSFGDLYADERSRPLFDFGYLGNSAVFDATVGPASDAVFAGSRFLMSRLSSLFGIDEKQAAANFQHGVGQINKRIAEIPMSPAASSARDEWTAVKPTGDLMTDLGSYMKVIGQDPAGFAAFVAETSAESAPQIAAALGVTVLTRSPAAGATFTGLSSAATEKGTAPAEYFKEKGIDISTPEGAMAAISDPDMVHEAIKRGGARGVVIGLMDGLSFGLASKSLSKSAAGNMVLQSLTQMAMGGAGEAGGQIAAGQQINLGDILLESLAEMATAPVEVAGHAGRRFIEGARNAKDAADRVAFFQQLSGEAQSSKLRARMPEKFRQFVEAATANGPVENVYVPADQFVQYFQGAGHDPYTIVDQLDGVTRDDLDTALAGGSDLQIPTATYAAKIAGSEHDAFLMENMRFDPSQFTAREAAEFNAHADDILREAWEASEQDRIENESLRSFEQEIYDTMVSRLRAAGRSTDVATTEAMLYPAFYRVMAERSGMTVDEFMRQYPLPQVSGAIPEGMQLKDADALNRTLAEARSRRTVRDNRKTLLDFISDYGGINDQGGELKARNAETISRGKGKKTLKLARSGVVAGMRDMFGTAKKHGVDDVARAAVEAGFLADDPAVQAYQEAARSGAESPDITNALWSAIDRELRGDTQYSAADAADPAIAHAAELDQIEEYLSSLGVTLDDDDAKIRGAIEGARQYAQANNKGRNVSTGPDGRTLLFDRMASDWSNHAKRILDGTARREMEVLRESPVLAAIVGGTGRIVFNQIKAHAIRRKHPDIPVRVWNELPALLADPAFVFVRGDGRVSVALDATTENGDPIIVGISDEQVDTITPWQGNADETGKVRLAGELHGALDRSGKVYAKSRDDLKGVLGETSMRSRPNPAQRQPRAVQAGFSRQGRGAKVIERSDIVKSAGRIFYQDEASADELAAENVVSEYARGEISPTEARRKIRAMGWDVGPDGFRKKRDSIELIAPDGRSIRTYGQSGPVNGPRGSIQFPAAGVGNGDTIVRLFEGANLSTMLHETGHYFLTVMQDLAAKGEAGAMDDFAAVKAWWNENADAVAADAMRVMPDVKVTAADVQKAIADGTTGDVMKDAAIDVGMQEQFARGFEAYLMEGKAPSAELRSAFEKFRAWLISVYRKLAGLNVKVSDEMRGVFDRMIASDNEIAKAAVETGEAGPVFATAEQMGLTPDQYDAFLKLRSQAQDEAKARLLRETMEPIKRQREKWFKQERAKVRDEVEREVNAYRYYRAIEWMGNRRWIGEGQPADMPDMRMSKDILVARYGEGVLKTLPRGKYPVYAVEGGIDPDEAAGWFGFGSGDEMIQAMEKAPPRKEAIEAETDRVMREQHGDILTDGEVEAAALDAVHTDKRGQWIAAELRAVVEIAGTGKALTAKEARVVARETIARTRVRDAMNANRFLAAERKAADEAARLGAILAREKIWLDAARRKIGTSARAALRGEGSVDAVAAAIDANNQKFETTSTTFHVDEQKRVSQSGQEFTIPAGDRTVVNLGYNELVAKLIDAKRQQLLNHALYSEARKVADEVEKAENFVGKLGKKSHRERIAGAGRREGATVDYLAAIDELLGQYDFRKMSGVAEQRRGALNAFVEAMTAAGRENELAIPDDVLLRAASVPYKTLSVEELRGVVDSLKNLEHMALRWDDLIDAQNKRKLDEVVTDIVAAFDANVKKRAPGRVKTRAEALRHAGRQFLDLVLNATTLLREIDGFKDGGAAYKNIKAPIDDAMSRLIERKQKAAAALESLYDVYTKDERRDMSVRSHMPELGYALSKWERIAVALNTGNAGNMQRLTDPKVRGSLTERQVAAVLATLDERDADFVQSVWDYIGSFRADIGAREKRATGVEPAWVEASPVDIGGKTLRGGYYPIKYDPRLSSLARDDETQEIAQSLQAGRFGKAQTRNGHLKERAQSSGRDVELDMSVMHRHINQVIYDLELSEPVANAWRILQDSRIRESFMASGKQADFDALETWLKDVAEGELRSADFIGRASRVLKSNFTAAKLAFNLSTVAIQVTGLSQTMVVVGKKDMLAGVTAAFRPGVISEITAKSEFMSTRQTTFNKDIYDFYSDSQTGPIASRWGDIKKEIIGPLSFWLMTKVQWHAVDVASWLAGYHQGLRRFNGDEAKAVAHADDIVKRSQASGLFADRSAIERGSVTRNARQNDVVRLFTTLGSYMFAKFNVAYERTATAKRTIQDEGVSAKSAQEALSWALDMAFLFTLEAVVTAAIKGGLPSGEDDDKKDGWLAFLAKQTAYSVMGTLPLIRDGASALQGFDGGGAYGSAMKDAGGGVTGTWGVASAVMKGEDVKKSDIKKIIAATGLATGLPATQINRAVDAEWRRSEGEDVSPVEYLLGRIRR